MLSPSRFVALDQSCDAAQCTSALAVINLDGSLFAAARKRAPPGTISASQLEIEARRY